MTTKHVNILLCTWNGAQHLEEMLQSFIAQSHTDWSLWVSDDGSSDHTVALLHDFRKAHTDRLITITGNRSVRPLGSASNFLKLLSYPALPPGLTAFADQDDVWLSHKLARAIAVLGDDPAPAVYASRTIHTNSALVPQRPSTLWRHPTGFHNALVQNVLAGNTIVMNTAATALLRMTCPAALVGPGVPFHDWWIYLVATGAGVRVINDDVTTLLYRQHSANVLGAHQGINAVLSRLGKVRAGHYSGWVDRNLAALNSITPYLTPENRRLLSSFADLRKAVGPWKRKQGMARLGIHHQTRAGNLMLAVLALTGRL